jgi:hypothetical protein
MMPVAFLALPMLMACRGTTEAEPQVIVDGVLQRQEVTTGQDVVLRVTVRNVSSDTVRIPYPLVGLAEVRNEQGRVVEFGLEGPFNMVLLPPRSVAPGDSLTGTVAWRGSVVEPAVGLATPGTYYLRAAVPSPDFRGYAYSPSVAVRLTAP